MKQITLRLPEELLIALNATQEQYGISRSEIIRQSIISQLDNHETR